MESLTSLIKAFWKLALAGGVYLLKSNCSQVLGIDLGSNRVKFANENIEQNYPHLISKLAFKCESLASLKVSNKFDVIVSKDTFEHIQNLEEVLEKIKVALKPGGRLFAGFGPLYHSVYGDHKVTRPLFPWFHLVFPESFLLKRINKGRTSPVKNIRSIGLNKLAFEDYMKIFQNSGLNIVYFETNQSDSFFVKILSLKKYSTQSIYIILEKN